MKAYYDKTLGRVVWDSEPDYNPNQRARERGPEVHASKPRHYADSQLPKNYPYHVQAGGKVSDGTDGHPKGTCLVDSWATIEGTVARARAAGEDISYESPFRRIK